MGHKRQRHCNQQLRSLQYLRNPDMYLMIGCGFCPSAEWHCYLYFLLVSFASGNGESKQMRRSTWPMQTLMMSTQTGSTLPNDSQLTATRESFYQCSAQQWTTDTRHSMTCETCCLDTVATVFFLAYWRLPLQLIMVDQLAVVVEIASKEE